MHTEDQRNALIAAQSAVKHSPTNAEPYVGLGMAYFYADKFDEAMTAFQFNAPIAMEDKNG